jgi:uncharacterized FAD-dependent dehydrogenase
MLEEICRLGGEVIYRCRMEDFSKEADGSLRVKTSRGDFRCGALILAPGHSARDTYLRLIQKGMAIEAKPISVGVRVEHLQKEIDQALYGKFARHPNLGPAEYNLSDTKGSRGVYTFCMCPGGVVVPAASEEGGVVVNGMSYRKRDGRNSNSAVVCSVGVGDFGNDPVKGMEFQRAIEVGAYAAGGGGFCAPITTVGDFLDDRAPTVRPGRILPT